jgi:hypothetical protein
MKFLLESTSAAEMEKTFRKFAPSILKEAKKEPPKAVFNEHAVGLRNGNGRITGGEDDDQEIVQLRALAGIVRK